MISEQSVGAQWYALRIIVPIEFMSEPMKLAVTVVQETMNWLAWVFHTPAEALDSSKRFGPDLNASLVSDFAENELDTVLEEVLYIRRRLGEKLATADPVSSVGEFCALVERYHGEDPSGCRRLLNRWKKEMLMDQRPQWRKLLFKGFGF
jgi:hypothetical protein